MFSENLFYSTDTDYWESKKKLGKIPKRRTHTDLSFSAFARVVLNKEKKSIPFPRKGNFRYTNKWFNTRIKSYNFRYIYLWGKNANFLCVKVRYYQSIILAKELRQSILKYCRAFRDVFPIFSRNLMQSCRRNFGNVSDKNDILTSYHRRWTTQATRKTRRDCICPRVPECRASSRLVESLADGKRRLGDRACGTTLLPRTGTSFLLQRSLLSIVWWSVWQF